MPLVYVFAASSMEAQPVLALAGRKVGNTQGSTGIMVDRDGDRFAVVLTGMGNGNAQAMADTVFGTTTTGARGGSTLPEKPDAILVIGLCGGLTESLAVHHIVAYKEGLAARRERIAVGRHRRQLNNEIASAYPSGIAEGRTTAFYSASTAHSFSAPLFPNLQPVQPDTRHLKAHTCLSHTELRKKISTPSVSGGSREEADFKGKRLERLGGRKKQVHPGFR